MQAWAYTCPLKTDNLSSGCSDEIETTILSPETLNDQPDCAVPQFASHTPPIEA